MGKIGKSKGNSMENKKKNIEWDYNEQQLVMIHKLLNDTCEKEYGNSKQAKYALKIFSEVMDLHFGDEPEIPAIEIFLYWVVKKIVLERGLEERFKQLSQLLEKNKVEMGKESSFKMVDQFLGDNRYEDGTLDQDWFDAERKIRTVPT